MRTWIRAWWRRIAYLLWLLLHPQSIDALIQAPPASTQASSEAACDSVLDLPAAPGRYTAVLVSEAGVYHSTTQRCLPVPDLLRRYHGKQTAVYRREAQDHKGRWIFRRVTH